MKKTISKSNYLYLKTSYINNIALYLITFYKKLSSALCEIRKIVNGKMKGKYIIVYAGVKS